jgi:hypothetical protein
LIVVLVIAALVPAGFAVAKLNDGEPGVPASACPEATALLEHHDRPTIDRFIPGCPDLDVLEQSLRESQAQQRSFERIEDGR